MNKYRFNFFILVLLCLVLNSCSTYNKDITTPPNQEFSFRDEFFANYDRLKQKEAWHEIIELGSKALNYNDLTSEERAKINLRLASSYYYIGDYKNGAISADNGRIGSTNNLDSLARSYYLLSACNRAMSLKTTNEKTSNYPEIAHEFIDKALALVNNHSVRDFTRAKIYFNAGALAQDVDANFLDASKYYLKAMEIFAKNPDNKDAYNRTVIRYIRSQLELGNVRLADIEAKELARTINKNTRTGVQLLELQSKIALRQGKFQKSYQKIEQALELAQKKGMKADIERLEKFKQNITS